jgi:hypothetical protein
MQDYKKIVDLYIEKWDKILFSTQPVDREKATKAVVDAYKAIDLPPPEIFFLSSPSLEQNSFFHSISHDDNPWPIRIKCLIYDKLRVVLKQTPVKNIDLDPRFTLDNLEFFTRGEIFEELCSILYEQYVSDIHCARNMNFCKILEYELSGTNVWPFDFYINHISDDPNVKIWGILKSLCEECPYLITYEKVCLIIEKPSELYLDRELVPHAEGKAAIKFADGYELYCNHGTVIPSKYGKIHPSEWKSESIVSDEDNNVIREDSESIISVLFYIGYKKFSQELPNTKDRYWNNKKGLFRTYVNFIEYSSMYIRSWLNFYYCDYYNFGERYYVREEIVDWEAHRKYIEGWYNREQEIYKNLPFEVSEELKCFYRTYAGDYQLATGLDFQPLSKASENFKPILNDYLLPISYGNRQEIYYVLCDNIQRSVSPVYCQFPNEEPIVYAECISSWMATISQCYRDGGYYVSIDELSGEKEIKQDLDNIEPIFEKFNPEQIDNWRKIWKSQSLD